MNSLTTGTPAYSLREFNFSDCEALVQHLNNPNITKRLRRVPAPYRDSDARHFIGNLINDAKSANPKMCNRAIIVDGVVVGCVGFTLDSDDNSGVIGYWLAEEFWGRGIMTHAARHMIDYGFSSLGLSLIRSYVFIDNLGSQNVLKKLGFKYVGDSTVRRWDDVIIPVQNYELRNSN